MDATGKKKVRREQNESEKLKDIGFGVAKNDHSLEEVNSHNKKQSIVIKSKTKTKSTFER